MKRQARNIILWKKSYSVFNSSKPTLVYFLNTKNSKRNYATKIDLHGGRSSTSGVVATVFGCTGFVGRSLVNTLGKIGSQIITPFRGEEKTVRNLKLMGDLGQIVSVWYSPRSKESIIHALQHSNVCINLIGANTPTKNYSLYDSNAALPGLIAECAKEAGVDKLIHISCIGANPSSPSEFLRTKGEGESLVLKNKPDSIIIRPCPLFGLHDFYINKLARIFYWWPIFLSVEPNKLSQPLWIDDLSKVISHVVGNEVGRGKILEIGGPKIYKNEEIYRYVKNATMRARPFVEVPPLLLKSLYGLIQNVSRQPKFSVEEIESLQASDKIVQRDNKDVLKVEDLGINEEEFKTLEEVSLGFLRPFRPIHLYDFDSWTSSIKGGDKQY